MYQKHIGNNYSKLEHGSIVCLSPLCSSLVGFFAPPPSFRTLFLASVYFAPAYVHSTFFKRCKQCKNEILSTCVRAISESQTIRSLTIGCVPCILFSIRSFSIWLSINFGSSATFCAEGKAARVHYMNFRLFKPMNMNMDMKFVRPLCSIAHFIMSKMPFDTNRCYVPRSSPHRHCLPSPTCSSCQLSAFHF